MPGKVLFLLKGYPRLSETFIAQEIRALELAGMQLEIWALRHPTDAKRHPVHSEIQAPVTYLPEYIHLEPLRVFRSAIAAVRLPGFRQALSAFLRDLRRDFTRNRARRFGQALVLAAEMPPDVTRIHAHFIHTPASVGRYASVMTGLPWSISAHAKDIWTSPDWDLGEKLAAADWAVTCTRAGLEELNRLAPPGAPALLAYHGLDLARFQALVLPRPDRDGKDEAKPFRLLTVARAVEKKGLDVLVAALAQLPTSIHWIWTHIGGGERIADLKRQAADLGIVERCTFLGTRDQAEVLSMYRQSDLFVLPCRIAGDGDRDGLPNVLVEASSQGLAVLSTPISGVVEFIDDGVNGALVPPEDASALALKIVDLAGNPALRYRLGKAAMLRVRRDFDHTVTITALFKLFAEGRPTPDTLPNDNTVDLLPS